MLKQERLADGLGYFDISRNGAQLKFLMKKAVEIYIDKTI